MATRNSRNLRALIQTLLSGDATLEGYLGSSGKVFQGSPEHVNQYPVCTWSIQGGIDEPYNPSFGTGIENTILRVELFTDGNPEDIDLAADRVFELLHGQDISDSNILVYSCYRISHFSIYEPEARVWRVSHRYSLVNVPSS